MEFLVNPEVFSNTFGFPREVADKYLKFCKGDHLKVLILIMRNPTARVDVSEIALQTDLSEYDVKEALLFWADAGILLSREAPKQTEDKKVVKRSLKPSREDVTKRGLEDAKLQYLLNQSQLILGRNLKGNEMETFGWLYEDLGLDVSVILFIVQYAKQIGKANIRYIEALASEWVEKGVENISDAEEQVRALTLTEQCWKVICAAFGIERRKPSKKEAELSLLWVDEWNISSEMLKKAYDVCIDSKAKINFPYIAKIIENWHASGYKTPTDIKTPNKQNNKMQGAYDIDLFEKMINSKD